MKITEQLNYIEEAWKRKYCKQKGVHSYSHLIHNKKESHPYSLESAKALDLFLKGLVRCYITDKHLIHSSSYNYQKDFTIISTPHPIGPHSPKAALLLEIMDQMLELQIDFNFFLKYQNMDVDDIIKKFGRKNSQILLQYIEEQKIDFENQKFWNENSGIWQKWITQIVDVNSSQETIELILDKAFKYKEKNFDIILSLLADLIIDEGIPKNIISREDQTKYQNIKIKIFASRLPKTIKIQSWDGVDTDGDSENDLSKLIAINEKENFIDLLIKCRNEEKLREVIPQPRRSCEANKKGVFGMTQMFTKIPIIQNIEELDDIEKFDNKKNYQLFKQFLEKQIYSKNVNNTLFFIIQICLGYLIGKTTGIVLSDFKPYDKDCQKILPQSILLKRFIKNYLQEIGVNINQLPEQKILPLCETPKDVHGFQKYFITVITYVKKLCSKDQFNEAAEVIESLGFFPGPSDLTRIGGSRAEYLMSQTIHRILFQINILESKYWQIQPIINACQNFTIHYGKGTSYARGARQHLHGTTGVTIQGNTFSMITSNFLRYFKHTGPINNEVHFPQNIDFINKAAIKQHKKLWGVNKNNLGILTKEINKIFLTDPLLFFLSKREIGTSGRRDFKIKIEPPKLYHEARAIGATADRAAIGLPLTPAYSIDLTYDMIPNIYDNLLELNTRMVEYTGLLLTDINRARTLGVSAKAIEKYMHYVIHILNIFSKKCKLDINIKEKDLIIDDVVNELVNQHIKNLQLQASDENKQYIMNRLQTFQKQIPEIIALRKLNTKSIINFQQELQKEEKIYEITTIKALYRDYKKFEILKEKIKSEELTTGITIEKIEAAQKQKIHQLNSIMIEAYRNIESKKILNDACKNASFTTSMAANVQLPAIAEYTPKLSDPPIHEAYKELELNYLKKRLHPKHFHALKSRELGEFYRS